ncbi:MAG: DDE-type integrase/transposase/recombinase [Victivallaceae bacterium]
MDFGEFQVENDDGTISKLYLFSMILGYSRRIYAEFVERCDLPTFLDCHIRAFDYFGGATEEFLYGRMENVYIRKMSGKDKFNDALIGFALHYGFKPMAAPACAARVKGKIERPYHFIRGFWRGYKFICRETANRDLLQWFQLKEKRVHGTTHEAVMERFERERLYFCNQCLTRSLKRPYEFTAMLSKTAPFVLKATAMSFPHTLVGKDLVSRVKGMT